MTIRCSLCRLFALSAIMGGVSMLGCAKPMPPYRAKSSQPPAPLKYCSDFTGHQKGAQPFVQGGTCCCTPTESLMAKLHADGFCTGWNAEQLQKAYEEKGIVNANNPAHHRCNNSCDHVPHVVLGGHCMSCPIPATANYEKVTMGLNP